MLRLRLAFGWYIGIFVLAAVLCLVMVNTLFQRMELGMIPVTVGLGLLLTYIIYAGVERRSVGLASCLSVVFGTVVACVAGVLITVPGFFAWAGARTGVLPALRQAVVAMA